MTITLDDLEFENSHLVKVRGMRPEYVSGGQLIDMVRDLAALAAHPSVSAATRETLTGAVDTDTPLMAAAREAGWALMEVVDGIAWEKRARVCDIAARLAAALDANEAEKLTVEKAWTSLCETPDITSPEEYPDHALITLEQLRDYMERAHSRSRADGLIEAAMHHERCVIAIRADPDNYKNGTICRRAHQLSDFHEQSAKAIRNLMCNQTAAPFADLERERAAIAAEARRYASHYPEASDGRNTFIIFADWVEARGTKVTR